MVDSRGGPAHGGWDTTHRDPDDLEFLGGRRTRVFLDRARGAVVRLVSPPDEAARSEVLAGFGNAYMTSMAYAPLGLMPEVLEVGANYCGTGQPFLKERYLPGRSLDEEFREDPEAWIRRLPEELVRIYGAIASGQQWAIGDRWVRKLGDAPLQGGPRELAARVHEAGTRLRALSSPGFRIHGDLRLSRLHFAGDRVVLLSWERTEVMTLAWEFALLGASLLFPEAFVPPGTAEIDRETRKQHARLWKEILRALPRHLVAEEDLRVAMRFRMGCAWLADLSHAVRTGDRGAAEAARDRLARLP